MDSLFTALSKYSRRENNDPRENFITQAFAWLLQSSSDFSNFFINKISKDFPNYKLINFEQVKWSTQADWGGVYPDMICEAGKLVYIFEHKVWSQLHFNQLNNYKNYAQKHYDSYKLILITGGKFQWGQEPDLALCWPDVYLYISDWLNINEKQNDKLNFLFNDFLKFLTDENLAPKPSISGEEVLEYYKSTNSQIEETQQKSEELFKNLINYKTGGIFEFGMEDGFHPIVKKHKGRIGIDVFSIEKNMTSEWLPGLFIGFLLDYKKYQVKPLNKEKGSDCCLIIDYNKPFVDNYLEDELYKQLVSELSKLFKNKQNGWVFHNHIEKDECKNKWHPLYIRKPIAEILDYSKDIKYLHEQASLEFVSEISYPLQILAKKTCFNQLRTANKNKIKSLGL